MRSKFDAMRRKNIKLELKDYRDSFNEPNKKKPYYLYVEWGNRNFYFSNKKKAERWLAKFKKESTELYREVSFMLFDMFKINLSMCELLSFPNAVSLRDSLIWHATNFNKLNLGVGSNIEIGRELKAVYNELLNHLSVYRKALRKNNRFRFLYEQIRTMIKKARRLKTEFDLLLSGADGINELVSDKLETLEFKNKIRIVA